MFQALLEKAFRPLTCPTPADLRQALESLPLSMETIAPIIPEPAGLPYGRRVLLVTEHVEIVLIQLPPAQESVPHNHGDSFGWEWILSGDLTNVIYSLAEDGHEIRPEKFTPFAIREKSPSSPSMPIRHHCTIANNIRKLGYAKSLAEP